MVSKRVSTSRITRGGGSHTWHQEPEQRPAGGRYGTATRLLWHQRRLHNAGAASLDLSLYTRRAKARVGRCSTPVYLSPSLSARRAVMAEVKGRVVAVWRHAAWPRLQRTFFRGMTFFSSSLITAQLERELSAHG